MTRCCARVAVLGAVAMSTSCAMSVADFDRLAGETAERDAARYRSALQDFNARGFELLSGRDDYLAMLDPVARERCVARRYDLATPAAAGEPAERVSVVVSKPGASGGAADSVNATALPDDACAFFDERTHELQVRREDGAMGILIRGTQGVLARSQTGEVVEVQIQVEIVDRRTVLVERTCNEMPVSMPSPIELDRPVGVIWGPRKVLRKVTMHVQQEELEIECTEIVQ